MYANENDTNEAKNWKGDAPIKQLFHPFIFLVVVVVAAAVVSFFFIIVDEYDYFMPITDFQS